ncbi:flagellar biosynthetic protein FliR [Primorskyibacter flagellatus]|uniref:Flagellar biosynthetic protein FliR n=1 Tax=Primorskyibacter flagellatus TaxID=1387277 RepID=A0A1W2A8A4_9RHOB|nr:flagellar biosynthetic protein FliR [Primorskyibacter flagellatus]SMC56702.1 flagellar biosynthetic protein FliR [Primorskyibacter flagellatus]
MTAMENLLSQSSIWLWALFVVFLRIGTAILVLPGVGERSIPVRIKLAISVALSLAVAPSIWPNLPEMKGGLAGFAPLAASESTNGLAIGLFLRLLILGLQIAGSIAAQSTSLSQIAGNTGAEPMPAIGNLLTVGGLALLFATGYQVKIVLFLTNSYLILPFGAFPDPSSLASLGIARTAKAFATAFTLAAPFIILSVLYNLTLGVINRAMPQLMVAFVGAPVITLGALAMMFVLAPTLLAVWVQGFDTFLSAPLAP